MPATDDELARRLQLTPETATGPGTSFLATMAVAHRFAPPQPEPASPKWNPGFQYPLADLIRLLFGQAALVKAHFPQAQDFFRAVGTEAAGNFLKINTGQFTASLLRDKLPHEMAGMMPSIFAIRLSTPKRSYERRSATEGVVQMKDDSLPPGYNAGVLQTLLTLNGHAVEVRPEPLSLTECHYVLRWGPVT